MNKKSVVIASPESAQRNRLRDLVNRMPEFEVIACTGDLMNTYNEVEERLPKAVLIADVLADLPEFEVMRALFSTLDIRWLVITSPNRKPRFGTESGRTSARGSDLFSIPGEAPDSTYVQQLCSLTRSDRYLSELAGSATRPGTPVPPFGSDTDSPNSRPAPARNAETSPVRPSAVPVSAALPTQPRRSPRPPLVAQPERPVPLRGRVNTNRLILIGASTGGVDALLTVLTCFPEDCPPTLVVQHTGTGFGESLAGLLDRQCRPDVRLATGPCPVTPGLILIGAGNRSHLMLGKGPKLAARLEKSAPVAGHIPSVDVLFRSAVHMADRVTAAILTGMGRDGADGLKVLHDAGAYTIAQDEASCVVYGMPRAAVELGAVRKVLPLNQIGQTLLADHGTSRVSGKELQK